LREQAPLPADPSIPPEFSGLLQLARRSGYEPVSVEVLPGDVGRRRYVRLALTGNESVLGVVYPSEEDDSRRRWLAARAHLAARIRVPALYAEDSSGNQILEDFGPEDLASRLASKPAERAVWLSRAAAIATTIADIPDPDINAPFDAAFFLRELDLAREAVFDLWLGESLDAGERATHDAWAASLAREIEEHPRVLCHRDFHGNNLFPVGGDVAAIDFQDLRSGPDSYDLASLLWERTTLEWMTEETGGVVVLRFADRRGLEQVAFSRRFDRVLLQRAWKVCGTFARAVAQGKGPVYRWYLPRELALVRRLLVAGGDCAFRKVFESRLAALC
jgi:aminoglycoside/choline kinase family phosphotransferase